MFSQIAEFPPDYIYIEPTNYCQLNCYMCPRRLMTRKKGLMDLNLFKKIIREFAENLGVTQDMSKIRIIVAGQGEPLIHNDIFEMLSFTKEYGFEVGTITNCFLFNEDKISKLLKAKIDLIYLSWYAFDEETYREIHGNLYFERFFRQTIYFLNHANLTHNDMHITVSWMECMYNKNSTTFAQWFFNRLPIDDISLYRVRNQRMLFELTNNTEEKDAIMDYYRELKNKNTEEILVGLECIYRMFFVHWDGKAFACPWDYNGEFPVGDMKETNIMDVWNGEKHRSFRQCVLSGDYSHIGNKVFCNDCAAATPRSLASGFAFGHKKIEAHPYRSYKFSWFREYFPVEKPEVWLDSLDYLLENWQSIQKEREQLLLSDISNFVSRYDRIAIYGAGRHTKYLLPYLKQLLPASFEKIVVIIDDDSLLWGKVIEDIPICSPEELKQSNISGIIISSYYFEPEIIEKLNRRCLAQKFLGLYTKDKFPVFFENTCYDVRRQIRGVNNESYGYKDLKKFNK